MGKLDRSLLLFVSLCMAAGGLTHWADIVRGGLFPYHWMPLAYNVFWTSLAVLDFAAVLLLWTHRKAGALLILVIMVADVAANSYAVYGLKMQFQSFAPLQAQSIFLGFVVGSFALLWRRQRSVAAAASNR
jgi:uncharacterized membrane protein